MTDSEVLAFFPPALGLLEGRFLPFAGTRSGDKVAPKPVIPPGERAQRFDPKPLLHRTVRTSIAS